jgi:hypothetical protein
VVSIQFKDIAEPFSAKGLKLPKLNALTADARSYEVLAIQPSGVIEPRDDFIGHSDRDLAREKFKNFIAMAVEKDADLVLSPEYSCPWETLKDYFARGTFPALGKLWALGCESITPTAFNEMVSTFPDLVWIHEQLPNSQGDFLDVVCYLLKAESQRGEIKNVVITQFKTVAMAGHDRSEADHLLLGRTTYFLHNEDDYVRFATLICSEALELQFDNALAQQFAQHPSVIFHPQLTNDPRQTNIRKYRNDLYSQTCSNYLEVIALNWARGFRIGTSQPSVCGGSAVFLKSDKFDRTEQRLHQNHGRGIYYSHWHANRTEMCLLNFDEHVFHFRTQKAHLLGAAVEFRRAGPEMCNLWKWNDQTKSWQETNEADDGFEQLCISFGTPPFVGLGNGLNVIERERLLTLSAGRFEPALDWYRVEKMDSFIAEADERSKRLTFVHEQNNASVEFRYDHLTRYKKLHDVILPNPANFPSSIEGLKNNWQLQPPAKSNQFRFNLVGRSGNIPGATVLFVGQRPVDYVRRLRDKFVKAWRNEDNERGEEKIRRLVIWYEDTAGAIKSEAQPLATFTDDPELPTSITKPERP